MEKALRHQAPYRSLAAAFEKQGRQGARSGPVGLRFREGNLPLLDSQVQGAEPQAKPPEQAPNQVGAQKVMSWLAWSSRYSMSQRTNPDQLPFHAEGATSHRKALLSDNLPYPSLFGSTVLSEIWFPPKTAGVFCCGIIFDRH